MYKLKSAFTLLLLFSITFLGFSQNPSAKKVKISGKVVEKSTGQPMEYTTITIKNPNDSKDFTGGITNEKGEFNIAVNSGVYDVVIEFMSFNKIELKGKKLSENTNLGTISLTESSTDLEEVQIRAEKSTVEIKLDKKVYNVGKDLMVKGGTVSDVLDNVPSVAVDTDGSVSVRGNDDVRILIDGKPVTAANLNEALRQIPADAVDKIEVVTNPSARYDSEGGGGVLNIILKKGLAQGVNGSVVISTGFPKNNGITGNINYKTGNVNMFSTLGYFDRNSQGNVVLDSKYLNPDGTPKNYIDERRENERNNKGYNVILGADWDINKTTTWTNSFNLRNSNGENPEEVNFYHYDANRENMYVTSRFNDQINKGQNLEFNTGLIKKFKKDGHKFTANGLFSKNTDDDASVIQTNNGTSYTEKTQNLQDVQRGMFQMDYVLPLGKSGQFEAGYKGDFNTTISDYVAGRLDDTGIFTPYADFTNKLEYIEKINAVYSQFGSKVNKFSYLFGLRYENSNIDINQLVTNDFHKKNYGNFFPSTFFSYSFNEKSSVSLSYSKRVSRPRGRSINPFSSYSSNINYFKGNPDLNPSFTDAFELGLLKTWNGLTLNSAVYLNRTAGSVQFVRREDGFTDNGTPIIVTTPINLATQYRSGFEFTLNYTPFKIWRLNSNFNLYRNETDGEFSYTNSANELITQNFDNVAYSWTARVTSKLTLPYKIDWQTNMNYNAPQTNAQGTTIGVFYANIAFSKDILKEKGTIAFNVQDLFNSRKRIFENNLPEVESYFAMQYRVRQFNLSFTYRFNKKKGEKERPVKKEEQQEEIGF